MAGVEDLAPQLVSAGTAAGGFTLVFAGFIVSHYGGFNRPEQGKVSTKYKRMLKQSLGAFALAVGSVGCGATATLVHPARMSLLGIVLLACAALLTAWVAYSFYRDIFHRR